VAFSVVDPMTIWKMFKDLCVTETHKNVVLATFWDQISTLDEGEKPEEFLKSRFLKELVEVFLYATRVHA